MKISGVSLLFLCRCPFCKSTTCRNSPTVKERERSAVLQISRLKMAQHQRMEGGGGSGGAQTAADDAYDKWKRGSGGGGGSDSQAKIDLRSVVAVRNTVRRLERDMHSEIMAAFAAPVSMG